MSGQGETTRSPGRWRSRAAPPQDLRQIDLGAVVVSAPLHLLSGSILQRQDRSSSSARSPKPGVLQPLWVEFGCCGRARSIGFHPILPPERPQSLESGLPGLVGAFFFRGAGGPERPGPSPSTAVTQSARVSQCGQDLTPLAVRPSSRLAGPWRTSSPAGSPARRPISAPAARYPRPARQRRPLSEKQPGRRW